MTQARYIVGAVFLLVALTAVIRVGAPDPAHQHGDGKASRLDTGPTSTNPQHQHAATARWLMHSCLRPQVVALMPPH